MAGRKPRIRRSVLPTPKPTIKVTKGLESGGVMNNIIRPRGAFWTPAEIETSLWLDPSDESTITESGNFVSQWDDKSGNDNHVTQPIGANQPKTNIDTINGLNTITTDTFNTFLSTLGYDFADEGGFTLGIIFNDSSVGGFEALFSNNVASGRGALGVGLSIDNKPALVRYGQQSVAFNSQFSDETDSLLTVSSALGLSGGTLNADAWNFGLFNGNRNITPSVTPSGGTVLWREGFHVGEQFFGHTGEIVITPDTSTETRQLIEGYLAWKWGVVSKLPIDHPYRWDGSIFGYGTLWTPAEVNTSVWFDASDDTTITETANNVNQWDDKSGNDNHASQGAGINQPTTNVRTVNNINVIDFDGVEFFTLGKQLNLSGYTKFVVFERDLNSLNSLVSRVSGEDDLLDSAGTPTGTIDVEHSGTVPVSFAGLSLSTPYMVQVTSTPIGEVGLTVDGDFKGVGVGNYGTATDDTKIGTFDSVSGLIGCIAEIVVFEGVPTSAERETVEGYLAWKWGLESNLPVTHPYKDAPPVID